MLEPKGRDDIREMIVSLFKYMLAESVADDAATILSLR